VYEHGVPAPPLSPGAGRTGALPEVASSGSFTKQAAAAALAAGDGIPPGQQPGPGLLPRMSDSTGAASGETPRAGRQVLNAAEAAELKAAAAAATAAAGTTGEGAAVPAAAGGAAAGAAGPGGSITTGDTSVAAGTSTLPSPPPGSAAAAAAAIAAAAGALALPGMGTGGTPSVEGGEAPSAAPEPKKKGRFKIIEEENPSRAPSKVPSSANLAAEARGRSLGSAAAVLPELLRLHEQSVNHANSLARVIDSVRASCSGGSLATAEELTAPLAAAAAAGGVAAAGAGALPPRKPAAGAAGGGLLSRVGSSRLLQVGHEGRGVTLQQLLTESNGDSMDVAEKLYERVQVRKRALRPGKALGNSREGAVTVRWVAQNTELVDQQLCLLGPWQYLAVTFAQPCEPAAPTQLYRPHSSAHRTSCVQVTAGMH
jgi:hypothetical protein